MDIWAHTEGGVPYGGAVKLLNQSPTDTNYMTYGRVSVRMWTSSTAAAGAGRYGMAALLINNNQWRHCGRGLVGVGLPGDETRRQPDRRLLPPNTPGRDPGTRRAVLCPPGTMFDVPHTYTMEWFPEGSGSRARWYCDGILIYDRTDRVPVAPMKLGHLVQVGTNGGLPPSGEEAHLYIDWITIHRFAPAVVGGNTGGASGGFAFNGAAAGPTPTSSSNFVTKWEEQFTGDLSKWVVLSAANGSSNGYPGGPGQFGTDEIQTMTNAPANLGVSGGQLRITPTRDAGGAWFSARIETMRVFKPDVGAIMRVEARLQFPNVHGTDALGYWPAFWMMGSSQRDNRWIWPACGEFDLAESVNAVNKNWSVIHGGPASLWGGPFDEPNGVSNGGVAPTSGDIWGEFHTFALEWDRTGSSPVDTLRWYLDGVLVHTVQPAVVSAADWAKCPATPGTS